MRKILVFSILFVWGTASNAQLSMQSRDDGILITESGENVLFFQSETKSIDGQYERCNYIHPLWSVDGTVLTEDFPSDHLHHRGIFWAWHQVWIGDKRIGDPWEIKDFEQNVTELEFMSLKDGTAKFNTKVEWLSDKWKKSGKKVPYLKENTTIQIHQQAANYRRIDFEIELLALTDNLSIGGSEDVKGYGGFSVRMKLPDDVSFSGPAGMVFPENTAVQSNGFINISGSLLEDNTKGGIVIVDHPENPGYPQSWILRERNSMQNAVYPGNIAIPVSKTEPLVLRYSLLIYSGKMSSKRVRKILK
ncbi:MAG: DUF6807 family protein [Bacteroidota bacterium]